MNYEKSLILNLDQQIGFYNQIKNSFQTAKDLLEELREISSI